MEINRLLSWLPSLISRLTHASPLPALQAVVDILYVTGRHVLPRQVRVSESKGSVQFPRVCCTQPAEHLSLSLRTCVETSYLIPHDPTDTSFPAPLAPAAIARLLRARCVRVNLKQPVGEKKQITPKTKTPNRRCNQAPIIPEHAHKERVLLVW